MLAVIKIYFRPINNISMSSRDRSRVPGKFSQAHNDSGSGSGAENINCKYKDCGQHVERGWVIREPADGQVVSYAGH